MQAGWIKLSAGDDSLTASETKILRAAARAREATDSVSAATPSVALLCATSWAYRGLRLARRASSGFIRRPSRNLELHLEMARRGA